MNLLAAAAFFNLTTPLGLLFAIAVVCVILWAAFALLAWAEIVPPTPVRIIAIALVSILIIYWLFELFGMLIHGT